MKSALLFIAIIAALELVAAGIFRAGYDIGYISAKEEIYSGDIK